MTRLRSILHTTARIAPLVGGVAAMGAAVSFAFSGSWSPASWALLAALWAFVLVAHRCPMPAPAPAPERGRVSVAFVGGPLDGAEIPLPALEGMPEMQGVEIESAGTRYRVATVEHTHYTAEAIR